MGRGFGGWQPARPKISFSSRLGCHPLIPQEIKSNRRSNDMCLKCFFLGCIDEIDITAFSLVTSGRQSICHSKTKAFWLECSYFFQVWHIKMEQ